MAAAVRMRTRTTACGRRSCRRRDGADNPRRARQSQRAVRTWVLFAVVAAGCAGPASMTPPPRDDAAAPARIRVVSYNVNFGLAGDRAGVDAVAALAPDLVFFQETNDAWRD